MFAIEEELDKKLWLYAIHVGKDRSEVVNDLLRPLVASMVLYDSRDRRGGRAPRSHDRPHCRGRGRDRRLTAKCLQVGLVRPGPTHPFGKRGCAGATL